MVGGVNDNDGVGAAWVFARSGSTWRQQGRKLTGSGGNGYPGFGSSVALSSDGNVALIGGSTDGGDQTGPGAAWVFARSGSSWKQQGKKLTGKGNSGDDEFGNSVALSSDGNTALIGGFGARAAWIFRRSGSGPRLRLACVLPEGLTLGGFCISFFRTPLQTQIVHGS